MKRSPAAPTSPFQFSAGLRSGVPVYRQLIDQVRAGIAAGSLNTGDQLPTVRQLAVDLAINPNTVLRAYRELEFGELLETQQGTGTFITQKKPKRDDVEREGRLTRLVSEFLAQAGAAGFTAAELLEQLREVVPEQRQRR